MEHMLAVALKPKMARFNDARVNRPDCDFVNFIAFDAEKIGHTRLDRNLRRTIPGVFTGAMARMKAERFEPRMALGFDAPLLGDFAFKPMCLGTGGG